MHRIGNNHTARGQGFAVLSLGALTAMAALLGLPLIHTAQADEPPCTDGACPSTYQIKAMPIQPSPNRFKFQTRISQAKLPVGDAVFPEVIVQLHDGAANPVCEETHYNVRVYDSVLNLEIGDAFNCDLDDVLALSAGLNFVICLGGNENCLAPVSLSTVPYASKANYAVRAQQAHKADVAAQCHYAHRMTADTSLFVTQKLGSGYYDFHTPGQADLLSLGDGTSTETVDGGYLQWTPVDSTNRKLNICGKNLDTHQLVPLSELVLHAAMTISRGDVEINGDTLMKQTLHVLGAAQVAGALEVQQGASIGQGLAVSGYTQLKGGVQTNGTVTIGSGADPAERLIVNSAAEFRGTVNIMGANSGYTNLDVTENLTVGNQINATSGTSYFNDVTANDVTANDVTVSGKLSLTGSGVSELGTSNASLITAGHVAATNLTGHVTSSLAAATANTLDVSGKTDTGSLDVNGLADIQDLTVTGAVNLPTGSVAVQDVGFQLSYHQVRAGGLTATIPPVPFGTLVSNSSYDGHYQTITISNKSFCGLIAVNTKGMAGASEGPSGGCLLGPVGAFADPATSIVPAFSVPNSSVGDWELTAIYDMASVFFQRCVAVCF